MLLQDLDDIDGWVSGFGNAAVDSRAIFLPVASALRATIAVTRQLLCLVSGGAAASATQPATALKTTDFDKAVLTRDMVMPPGDDVCSSCLVLAVALT
ncbi:MAG: hypothetical protein ACOY3N_15145 [Bradyrhizobium sp.]|uniref:hypothetical protein n=1 Tax=Bradyrhizobium sp. TaxID=376 RepID=UPI0034709010